MVVDTSFTEREIAALLTDLDEVAFGFLICHTRCDDNPTTRPMSGSGMPSPAIFAIASRVAVAAASSLRPARPALCVPVPPPQLQRSRPDRCARSSGRRPTTPPPPPVRTERPYEGSAPTCARAATRGTRRPNHRLPGCSALGTGASSLSSAQPSFAQAGSEVSFDAAQRAARYVACVVRDDGGAGTAADHDVGAGLPYLNAAGASQGSPTRPHRDRNTLLRLIVTA